MDKQVIIDELRNIIEDYLKSKTLDLVDFIYRYEGRDLVLRILVDRPQGGISIEDCAYLNKEISLILDERDILEGRYILEVSSPGVDRPLKEKKDFSRCINKKAIFFLNELINGKLELEGLISKVEADSVYIEAAKNIIEIPIAKINKAKQSV